MNCCHRVKKHVRKPVSWLPLVKNPFMKMKGNPRGTNKTWTYDERGLKCIHEIRLELDICRVSFCIYITCIWLVFSFWRSFQYLHPMREIRKSRMWDCAKKFKIICDQSLGNVAVPKDDVTWHRMLVQFPHICHVLLISAYDSHGKNLINQPDSS